MSVNVGAGMPYCAQAARNAASTIGPVMRVWAVTDRAYREWSSIQVRTSVSEPSASG